MIWNLQCLVEDRGLGVRLQCLMKGTSDKKFTKGEEVLGIRRGLRAEGEGRVDEEGSAKRRTGREWPPKPWAGGKSCVSVRPCFMEKSCSSSGWDLAFALAFTYPANWLSPPLNQQSRLPWTHLQVTLPHLLKDLSKTVGPGVKRRDKSRTLWPRQ